jgi:Uma2 family endonuclease
MGFVACLIDGFTSARDIDGFTFVCRFACKIDELNGLEPDVGYVRPERKQLVEEEFMVGGPDLAVEIVSRDSKSRDYGEKRQLYESAGVTEYWIVDPIQRRVEFLRLTDGGYEPVPLEDNRIFRTVVIPGFWLNVEWLLANKVPRAYHCLEKILASGKKSSRRKKY